MEVFEKALIQIIASEVFGTDPDNSVKKAPDDELVLELYNLSQKHDLAHLAGYALDKNNLLPVSTVSDKFREQVMTAVFLYESLEFDFSEICRVLEEARTKFIPLKGSVLKNLYPQPWMRTSCDIDILVHKEDLEKVTELFEKKSGFVKVSASLHDITFRTPGGNLVELHFDLIEEGRSQNAAEILGRVWEFSYPKEKNGYLYRMNDEMFLLYHIAHIAKHFESGGCGIRSFLDLGIMLDKSQIWSGQAEELLEKSGLLVFAKAVRNLCEVWFFGGEHNTVTLRMQEYIMSSGTFGTKSRKLAARQGRTGGKFRYILSRIFLPFDELKLQFPILEKRAFLTPFCEICRWFRLAFGKESEKRKKNIGVVKNTSKKDTDEITEFFKMVGLD
ncbi:MAG: nucleotidyltransferase family protein [Clostridia bacterium]|nr:nucleotidyltransferase family protein [Clostridia bacterium]